MLQAKLTYRTVIIILVRKLTIKFVVPPSLLRRSQHSARFGVTKCI